MQNRLLGLSKAFLWFAWLVFAVMVAAGPFRWEMDYFLIHGNQVYYRAMLGMLALLILFCCGYLPLRRRGSWRWELSLIAAFALCFAALEQPVGLLIGLLLFLACFSTGHRLARLFGTTPERPAEILSLGFSFGCAAWLPVLFALGVLHAYYRGVSWLLVLTPLVLWPRDAMAAPRAILKLCHSAREALQLRHPMCGIAVIFLAIGVFLGAAATLTPSITFDSLNMHLPAAQYFSAQHALQPLPHQSYSYYPQGFETLLMVAYHLGGQPAAQMVAPIFFAAFLLALFEIASACELDLAAILTGIACVVITPFILWDGSQTKNDIALGSFQLAALLACLRYRNSGRRGWLMLSGILLASSVAIKYTAIYGAIPLVILLFASLDWKKAHGLRAAAVLVLLMGMLGSYWQVRAFIYTGNPVYPLSVQRATEAAGSRGGGWRKRAKQVGQMAWRINFIGRPHFESPIQNPLGMLLVAFAPMALLAPRRRKSNRRACLFYAGLYIMSWIGTVAVLRYALPAIALLIVFLVGKVKDAYDQNWARASGPVRLSIVAALAGSLAFGLLGVILVESAPLQFSFLAHRIAGDAYLAANLPEYKTLRAFGRLDQKAVVFAVGACSRSYAPDPGAFGCSSAGPARVVELLDRDAYQYIAFPASAGAEERGMYLTGWKAEQVYQDHNYLGFRIWRDH